MKSNYTGWKNTGKKLLKTTFAFHLFTLSIEYLLTFQAENVKMFTEGTIRSKTLHNMKGVISLGFDKGTTGNP